MSYRQSVNQETASRRQSARIVPTGYPRTVSDPRRGFPGAASDELLVFADDFALADATAKKSPRRRLANGLTALLASLESELRK
jgi:hypothetical protein